MFSKIISEVILFGVHDSEFTSMEDRGIEYSCPGNHAESCSGIWDTMFCHLKSNILSFWCLCYNFVLFLQLPFVDFLNHDVSCKSFLSFDQENNYAEVCIDFVPTFPISPKHIFSIFLSLPFWKDLKWLGVLCNHVFPFNTAPCNHQNIVCV